MFITAILTMAGLGFACWLVFNLAVYALPFFAGMTIGLATYHHGIGPLGAIVIGLFSGAMTLVAGQFLFAHLGSPILRVLLAGVFAVPAAIAGFHLIHGLSGIGGASEAWRQILGYVGAIGIGAVACARIGVVVTDERRSSVVPVNFPYTKEPL